jgi:hypothetical protein
VNDEVQVSPMGFSAPIIVWDYAGRKLLHKLILHKVCDFELQKSLPSQDWMIDYYVETGMELTHLCCMKASMFANMRSHVTFL